VHGKKKRYVKLHFAVNTKSHEVVAMEVSADDAHDVEAAPGLVEGAERNVRVARVYGDGAYDSGDVYRLLEGRGIEPSSSLGGTAGWMWGSPRGGGPLIRSGASATRGGLGSPGMGGVEGCLSLVSYPFE